MTGRPHEAPVACRSLAVAVEGGSLKSAPGAVHDTAPILHVTATITFRCGRDRPAPARRS